MDAISPVLVFIPYPFHLLVGLATQAMPRAVGAEDSRELQFFAAWALRIAIEAVLDLCGAESALC